MAKQYIELGADGSTLNVAECYLRYRSDLTYLDFAVAEFNMDMTGRDAKGKSALSLAFESEDI